MDTGGHDETRQDIDFFLRLFSGATAGFVVPDVAWGTYAVGPVDALLPAALVVAMLLNRPTGRKLLRRLRTNSSEHFGE